MTVPTPDDIRRYGHRYLQFIDKVLDAGIDYPGYRDPEFSDPDGQFKEQFKDELRECGLFEEYDELQNMSWLESALERQFARGFSDGLRERLLEPPDTRRLSSAEQLSKPPAFGEMLLVLFCPRNRARHVMGDLEEIFNEDVKTRGPHRAKLLYWSGVLHSIGPLLWVKVRKAGLVALLVEIGRRWVGLS
jgi:hypothetical protein